MNITKKFTPNFFFFKNVVNTRTLILCLKFKNELNQCYFSSFKNNKIDLKKNFFSSQTMHYFKKAKNELDRGSLYLLKESIDNDCDFLNEEKKKNCHRIIDQLYDLVLTKHNLIEEKTKILSQRDQKKKIRKNKELLGLFLTGFFFAIGSVTHSAFFLISVYGLYIMKGSTDENNYKIKMEKQYENVKKQLVINKVRAEELLKELEKDLIDVK